METLNAVERNAVMGALYDRVEDTWRRAVNCYSVNMPELGDFYANQCLVAGTTYRKLIDWPNEPECGTL